MKIVDSKENEHTDLQNAIEYSLSNMIKWLKNGGERHIRKTLITSEQLGIQS